MHNKEQGQYYDRCHKCNSQLLPGYDKCPFCGEKLQSQNIRKTSITFEEIEDRRKATKNLSKDVKRPIAKIIKPIILIFVFYQVFTFCAAALFVIFNTSKANKMSEIVLNMESQDVDEIHFAEEDISDIVFTDTSFGTTAGYIQESETLFKVPFQEESYDYNTSVYGAAYIDKCIITAYDTNTIHATCNENLNIDIRITPSYYYDDILDILGIYDEEDVENIERLDDVVLGNLTFQCYVEDDYWKEFTLISNPHPGYYIIYEAYVYDAENKDNYSIENIFLLKNIELNFEESY